MREKWDYVKSGHVRFNALGLSFFRRNAGRCTPFSHSDKKLKSPTRTWSGSCFSGFVAPALPSCLKGSLRNESPKNSGVYRWWLSGRLCCAALAAGIDRLGLVAPALKSSSRSRCENKPLEFRPYCPAMKLRRGRNADNFRCSRFFRPWLRCH